MRDNTKGKLIEIGAEIIHLKGFNHTGIKEILDAAKVPKGSFYNYFDSKEDFGLQVIDYFVNYMAGVAGGVLADDSVSPLERVRKLLAGFIELFKSKEYGYGCPIGNLAQEMGDLNPAFREKLRYALDSLANIYADALLRAQEAEEIPRDLDVHDTARFIVSSWHGALIHMKAVGGPEPLENHLRFIFDHVLKR
jgi:TetR/AcrR family transcriptional regulator, transcriptional repressor for nem operon